MPADETHGSSVTQNRDASPNLTDLPELAQITNGHSLWCADCNLGLEPTSTNPIGYLYCLMAKHQVVVGLELLGFDRLDAVIDRAFARAGRSL